MLHQQVFLLCNQVSLSFWPPASRQPCAMRRRVTLSPVFFFHPLSHPGMEAPSPPPVPPPAPGEPPPVCTARRAPVLCSRINKQKYSAPRQFSVLILKDADRVSIKPTFRSCPSRPALGGLLSSSYRQHQESLAAERQRRRVEREERLQRIEREERNKHRCGLIFWWGGGRLRWKSCMK